LIKNNEDTIEKCLNSLLPLKANTIIADIGGTDQTATICQKLGYKVEKHSLNNDHSQLRNRLLSQSKTHWQMYLDPHEFLAAGVDEIKDIVKSDVKKSFYIKIAQSTIISKEIRLWSNSIKFINPVYETIKDNSGLETKKCIIYSKQAKIDLSHRLNIIDNWKITNPVSPDPYYYQALSLLLAGNYIEFSALADHYLFREKTGKGSVMMRYHLAMVQAYQLDMIKEAIENTLTCIAHQPLMAEFWCLLGDIHYKIKQYEKAVDFYDNALILGAQRLQSDMWPIDVSKYKDHPIKMIDNTKKIISETKIYHPIKHK
jgi:glycosyltransferase involved in cell wall biosynthesis